MASRPINVSWSRINQWLTCKWRYWHFYEEYFSPIKTVQPLFYGSVFHALLEYVYSTYDKKANPTKRMHQTSIRSKLKREGAKGDDLETLMRYAMTYVKHMRRHKSAEPERILATEFPFSVPLSMDLFKKHTNAYPPTEVNVIGVMDLVCIRRSTGEIWDHKLQSNHPRTSALDHPPISYPQMGIYAWASMHLGAFIGRSVLNVYGKRRSDNQVQRYPIKITKTEAMQWEKWLYSTIADMLSNPMRNKSLGRMECDWCPIRYPCQKHQSQGTKGYQKAVDQTLEKKPFDRRGRPKWKSRFPEAVIRALRRAK
jgi:hypothetical protein